MVFDIESPIFALINCHFLPYIKFDEKINAILAISAILALIWNGFLSNFVDMERNLLTGYIGLHFFSVGQFDKDTFTICRVGFPGFANNRTYHYAFCEGSIN